MSGGEVAAAQLVERGAQAAGGGGHEIGEPHDPEPAAEPVGTTAGDLTGITAHTAAGATDHIAVGDIAVGAVGAVGITTATDDFAVTVATPASRTGAVHAATAVRSRRTSR
ncbi:hypothetical protein ACFXGT_25495 [Streptomyces sp. NPDC059352]|uniref:hypothetical protein n=1 Tax=Streptomyces sp. NPDC059352 TaxID=3346810 RepID=UPI0036876F61